MPGWATVMATDSVTAMGSVMATGSVKVMDPVKVKVPELELAQGWEPALGSAMAWETGTEKVQVLVRRIPTRTPMRST